MGNLKHRVGVVSWREMFQELWAHQHMAGWPGHWGRELLAQEWEHVDLFNISSNRCKYTVSLLPVVSSPELKGEPLISRAKGTLGLVTVLLSA